jgi:hypothetical protein
MRAAPPGFNPIAANKTAPPAANMIVRIIVSNTEEKGLKSIAHGTCQCDAAERRNLARGNKLMRSRCAPER